jgi:hypothetical protein
MKNRENTAEPKAAERNQTRKRGFTTENAEFTERLSKYLLCSRLGGEKGFVHGR